MYLKWVNQDILNLNVIINAQANIKHIKQLGIVGKGRLPIENVVTHFDWKDKMPVTDQQHWIAIAPARALEVGDRLNLKLN